MRSTTLVVMAAGIGSRFGGGIKQLEAVGPNGEIIIDYSIYDALEAGFNKVIFIIRRDIEKEFKEIIGDRIAKICPVEYAFQSLDSLPAGYTNRWNRKKPWGTGQAVLACKDLIQDPFVVINADDYYGKEAFKEVHDFLVRLPEGVQEKPEYCMAGFILKNTLSKNGGVTRGICRINSENELLRVDETREIVRTSEGASGLVDGKVTPLDVNSFASMNMWGLTPQFLDELESGFEDFLSTLPLEDNSTEYLLPIIIDGLIKKEEVRVKLLQTNDQWFGVTYKEDKGEVVEAIRKMVADGIYPEHLH